MKKEQINKLKTLLKQIEFAKGTDVYEPLINTLLTFLDGVLSGIK